MKGRVIDSGGQPIPDLALTVHSRSPSAFHDQHELFEKTITDEKGQFSARVAGYFYEPNTIEIDMRFEGHRGLGSSYYLYQNHDGSIAFMGTEGHGVEVRMRD